MDVDGIEVEAKNHDMIDFRIVEWSGEMNPAKHEREGNREGEGTAARKAEVHDPAVVAALADEVLSGEIDGCCFAEFGGGGGGFTFFRTFFEFWSGL